MRIIVEYTAGNYECTCDHVLKCYYESAEAWLVHFEEKLKATYQAYLDNPWRKWSARRPDPCGKKSNFEKWYSERPVGCTMPDTKFTFCGIEFDCLDFLVEGKFDLPTVRTVDEWFPPDKK